MQLLGGILLPRVIPLLQLVWTPLQLVWISLQLVWTLLSGWDLTLCGRMIGACVQ